jgi:hypothetical protein
LICPDKIESLGTEPLKKDLRDFGGWPVIEGDQWKVGEFSWTTETIYKMRQVGFSVGYLFDFTISPDFHEPTDAIITVSI